MDGVQSYEEVLKILRDYSNQVVNALEVSKKSDSPNNVKAHALLLCSASYSLSLLVMVLEDWQLQKNFRSEIEGLLCNSQSLNNGDKPKVNYIAITIRDIILEKLNRSKYKKIARKYRNLGILELMLGVGLAIGYAVFCVFYLPFIALPVGYLVIGVVVSALFTLLSSNALINNGINKYGLYEGMKKMVAEHDIEYKCKAYKLEDYNTNENSPEVNEASFRLRFFEKNYFNTNNGVHKFVDDVNIPQP